MFIFVVKHRRVQEGAEEVLLLLCRLAKPYERIDHVDFRFVRQRGDLCHEVAIFE
jgi:hypothetical protein